MKKVLFIVSLLLIVGCGTRKVIKSSTDIVIEEKSVTKDSISKETVETTEVKDTTVYWVEEYEPIDSTKQFEININGKIIKGKNVRFKTSKVKKGVSILKKENHSLQSLKIAQKETNTNIELDDKDVETDTTWPWWWVLIVLMGAGIIYADYKRL